MARAVPVAALLNLRLTIDGHAVAATLNDSATARDFAELLPLTLDLSDFHQTERIADLHRRLSTADAPEGTDPRAGALAYYASWGNLALYYRNASAAAGLIVLDQVTDGIDRLATAEKITIEAAA